MRFARQLASVVALAFLLSTMALARRDKQQASFDLSEAVQVGSTQLQPGHYKAEWKPENANNVQVDIMEHNKTVATAQGQLKDLKKPADADAVTTKAISSNKNKLVEIDFRGHKEAIVFGG